MPYGTGESRVRIAGSGGHALAKCTLAFGQDWKQSCTCRNSAPLTWPSDTEHVTAADYNL